jgi:hypothetical protein
MEFFGSLSTPSANVPSPERSTVRSVEDARLLEVLHEEDVPGPTDMMPERTRMVIDTGRWRRCRQGRVFVGALDAAGGACRSSFGSRRSC